MGMIKTVVQAWKIPEIRSKMLFTLLMLLVYRIGSNIPVPNINRAALAQLFTGETGLFDLFDLFSGGSFSNFTIFALSITPYITASIIVQLLTMAFPYFENLARQGVEGRKKMAQITRYMTVVLAVIQAIGLTVGLFRRAVIDTSVFSVIVVILVLTAGTAFLMWLGEQINEKGIGNGISLLIFAGIVDRIPSAIRSLYTQYTSGNMTLITIILLIVAAILCLLFSGFAPAVVFMVFYVLATVINYPKVKDSKERVDAHAKSCLMMCSVLFAAGCFTGIMKGTGMITAMASALVAIIPQTLGQFFPLIVGIIATPASLLFDPDSFYYGVLPVLAETAQGFGVAAADVGRSAILGQMTLGFPISPLTASTFLLIGLSGVELGEHQKKTLPLAWLVSIIMLVVAIITGAVAI